MRRGVDDLLGEPGVGRPALGRKARRFAAGLYRYRNTSIYVNKGVGFGFKFRYGVRPEIAIFTLQSGNPTLQNS